MEQLSSAVESATNEQPREPLKSYGELGLGENFADLVRKRQKIQESLSGRKELDGINSQLKLLLAEHILGAKIDTSDADALKDTLVSIAGTGETQCEVEGWNVIMTTGCRTSIDESKLRLSLAKHKVRLDTADAVVVEATTTTEFVQLDVVKGETPLGPPTRMRTVKLPRQKLLAKNRSLPRKRTPRLVPLKAKLHPSKLPKAAKKAKKKIKR